jgi:hypothetical protein
MVLGLPAFQVLESWPCVITRWARTSSNALEARQPEDAIAADLEPVRRRKRNRVVLHFRTFVATL